MRRRVLNGVVKDDQMGMVPLTLLVRLGLLMIARAVTWRVLWLVARGPGLAWNMIAIMDDRLDRTKYLIRKSVGR